MGMVGVGYANAIFASGEVMKQTNVFREGFRPLVQVNALLIHDTAIS